MTIERAPFERQTGESPASFAAFTVYRDQVARRSGRFVAVAVGKRHGLIARWMARDQWVLRAAAYDAHVDARARAAHEKAILDLRERAARQARAKAASMMLPDVAISARIERPARRSAPAATSPRSLPTSRCTTSSSWRFTPAAPCRRC